jgi:hypothetical protein
MIASSPRHSVVASSLRGSGARAWRLLGSTLALLAVLGGAPACGGSQSGSADPARQIASANARLSGEWLLVQFQPEARLEFVMAQLLAVQVNALVATFDGQVLSARGVGVTATRTYRIEHAEGDRVKLALFDDTGVRYDVLGEFQGNQLRFQALTPPWRGMGTLQRR